MRLYLLLDYILATPAAALPPQALTAFYRIAFSRKKAVEQSKVNLGQTHSVGDSLTTKKLPKAFKAASNLAKTNTHLVVVMRWPPLLKVSKFRKQIILSSHKVEKI